MKYSKAKKRFLNLYWLNRKLRTLAEEWEENEHFYDFECSTFFKGKHLARLNRKIYDKKRVKLDRKIRQVEWMIDLLRSKEKTNERD